MPQWLSQLRWASVVEGHDFKALRARAHVHHLVRDDAPIAIKDFKALVRRYFSEQANVLRNSESPFILPLLNSESCHV